MATLQDSGKTAPGSTEVDILKAGQSAIRQEAAALELLADSLDRSFADAVSSVLACDRRVVVTGVGKSGHVGRKIAATLAATGTASFFLHASEAAHGDLGMILPGDLLLFLSNSGFTRELRPLLNYARRIAVPTIAIVTHINSPLGRSADIIIQLPAAPEACPAQVAPTTSTTMMMAMGDALAVAVMAARGLNRTDLAQWHPGGKIGSSLSPVDEVVDMRGGVPLVRFDAPMRDVVFEMTTFGKGVAGVVDEEGCLVGVITDGDLRRAFDHVLTARARDIMTEHPLCVPRGTPAEEVLELMNAAKITVVFVTEVDDPRRAVGVAHIHDLSH